MASRFWVGGTGTWDASDTTHWASSSGGAGGQSVPGASDTVTLDGSSGGGTVTLGYSPTVISITMGAFTGTFDAATYSPTMQTFNCSGTGTRTLNMGSGTWTITGNNATVWTTQTTTGLTNNTGTSTVNLTYSGSTGTRTIIAGASFKHLYISAGSDIIALGSSLTCTDLNFSGFTGTWSTTTTLSCFGDLALGLGMTVDSQSGVVTMKATSGTNTITSNGVQFNRPITFDGVGGTWTLQDALNMDGATARTLTITNGTFNANGKNVTCGLLSSSNSNTRTLNLNGSTVTLTGTGTVFNIGTTTGLTYTGTTATINITDTSSSSKGFQTGGLGGATSQGTVVITAGGSGAVFFTQSANTSFVGITCVGGSKTITFTSAKTYTVTNWNVNGTNGNLVTINSSTPGSAATISVASGIVESNFVSLQDSTATGGATFRARFSTNVSGNTGWTFTGRQAVAQRQNLLTYSQNGANAAWLKAGLHATTPVVSNDAVGPDGTTTADRIVEDNTAAYHILYRNTGAVIAPGIYTVSASLKEGTRRYGGVQIIIGSTFQRYFVLLDLRTGTVVGTSSTNSPTDTSYSVLSEGNGWYKISVTARNPNLAAVYVVVAPSDSATPTYSVSLPSYTGDNTSGIYCTDYQIVRANWSGPKVKTTTVAVDTGNIRSLAGNRLAVRQDDKSVNFVAASDKIDTGADWIGTGDVTVIGKIKLRSGGGSGTERLLYNGKFDFSVLNNGTQLRLASDSATFATSAVASIALNNWFFVSITRTSAGVVNFRINGSLSGTANQSSGTPAAGITNVIIGNTDAGTRNTDGLMAQLSAYNRILTTAEQDALYFNNQYPSDYATSIIRDWRFDNDTATTVYAYNNISQTGTITGATFSQDTPFKSRDYPGKNLFVSKIGGVGSAGYPGITPTGAAARTTSGWIEDERLGWYAGKVTDAFAASYDSSVVRTGSYSLKLSTTDATGKLRAGLAASAFSGTSVTAADLNKMIALKPNTSYTLSCYVKTNNAAASAVFLSLTPVNSDLSAIITQNTAKLSGTNDWTLLTATLTTASTAIAGRVIMYNDVTGNVSDAWFDINSLTLTENKPATRNIAP